jgi:hypothetical protein
MKQVLLFVGLLSALMKPALAVAGPISLRFSVDPASPVIDGNITPDDVLRAGPAVHTQGRDLGLQDDFFIGLFDDLDALSYGRDPLTAPLYFSVDRVAVGVPGSAVHAEALPAAEEAHGDVFQTIPPFGSNTLFVDEETIGLEPGFFGDDLDALDLDSSSRQLTYFSIDGLSATNGFGTAGLAGDILISAGTGSFGVFAQGVAHIGLHSDDDLDALVLLDLGTRGQLDPGVDMALFSLSTFSPSAFTFTGNPYLPGVPGFLSPADILVTAFTGSFALAFPAATVGLLPPDELDALDTETVPEPAGLFALGLAAVAVARRVRKAGRRTTNLANRRTRDEPPNKRKDHALVG